MLEADGARHFRVLPDRSQIETMEIVRRGNEEAYPLAALEPLADGIVGLEVLVPAELAGRQTPSVSAGMSSSRSTTR